MAYSPRQNKIQHFEEACQKWDIERLVNDLVGETGDLPPAQQRNLKAILLTLSPKEAAKELKISESSLKPAYSALYRLIENLTQEKSNTVTYKTAKFVLASYRKQKISPEISSIHSDSEISGGDSDDRSQPPTNPQNIPTPDRTQEITSLEFIGRDLSQFSAKPTSITTAANTGQSQDKPISLVQDDLGIDSSISSWASEKSYNKFIAREIDLRKLIEYIEDDIDNKVLNIWGMGGLGKTATCHRLISLLYRQKRLKKIVWINAKRKQFHPSQGKSEQIRESRLDIQDAILDIGKELSLDAWFIQDVDRLQYEISNLFTQESYLLVVDGLEDAESPKLLISDLRKILGQSSLFLTSRKQIGLENGLEYRLPVLDEQSSYAFIQQMIVEKCADEQAIGQQISQNIEKVITATNGMPLAMKLLVSQAKFLGLERVLERLNSVVEEEEFYSYLYWEVYQELCKENQIDVLKILIFLSNQSSLSTPQSWLYDFDDMNKRQIDNAIRVMYHLSLIEVSKYNKEDKQINLHSFTAQYFRETLKEKLT